ncbi:phage tail protein [Halodesulfovibrio aestuarii]|uniref:phage tail protein n=1 Tax=Halodesulfovibrio aestuarii TaxID=126333 RepID=UPI003D33E5C9
MKNRLLRASIYVLASIAILFAISTANAADSTSFNPTAVAVKVDAISGVPIGGVIPWPSSTPPKNYLECNGQSFSAATYPKLQAVLGSTAVPNYQNEFLRGAGAGRTVGSKQGDAIRNIKGTLSGTGFGHYRGMTYGGSFYQAGDTGYRRGTSGSGWYTPNIGFDASRTVPTADENRPRNVAVMYIIKAK